MYKKFPIEKFQYRHEILTPILTLKNQNNSIINLCLYDNNYVLFINSESHGYAMCPYWPHELVEYLIEYKSNENKEINDG